MLRKIVTILSMLSIHVQGHERDLNLQYAVSSQSFHREDVPLSYKYSNVHEYKPNNRAPYQAHNINLQHMSNPERYALIQYAPLQHVSNFKGPEVSKDQNKPEQMTPKPAPTTEYLQTDVHVYSTERSLKKDHLEPRLLKENHNTLKAKHRLYVPGHNIVVLPPPKNRYLGHVDPFLTRQKNYQNQQAKAPKFVYYQKQKPNIVENTSTYNKQPSEDSPTSTVNSMIFLGNTPLFPKDFGSHLVQHHSLHNELTMEKPLTSYKRVPRLHLNIARVYSVASVPNKAPQFPVANAMFKAPDSSQQHSSTNVVKPPILAQTFFMPSIEKPQNTLMYPVDN